MPYETGTATNPQDLLAKLATFAGANGWTVHFSGARTGGAGTSGHALILSRGVVQAIFQSNNGGGWSDHPNPWLETLLWSGAYNAASTESQPNPSAVCQSNWMTGPYVAYHFFASALTAARPYLHVVVEVQSGTFRHSGIGQLRQMGAFTNGAYAFGTSHNMNSGNQWINNGGPSNGSHSWPFCGATPSASNRSTLVRADFGGVSPRYCRSRVTNPILGDLVGGFGDSSQESLHYTALASSAASAFTGRAPLLPLLVSAVADNNGGTSLRHPLGFPDDMRYVRVDNFSPGDTITLGSDTWRIFPAVRKGSAAVGPNGIQNSFHHGYAYRQVP